MSGLIFLCMAREANPRTPFGGVCAQKELFIPIHPHDRWRVRRLTFLGRPTSKLSPVVELVHLRRPD